MTTPITYTLASTANYKFNIVRMGFSNYDQVSYLYKTDFPDVEITRPDIAVDLGLIHSNYLVTVNGYVFNTVYTGGRLYLPLAAKSMLRSRANVVGMLNLGKVGTPIKTAITPSMISLDLNTLAYDKVFITLPNPVAQPLLIMGGYIIPYNDQYFYRVSDNTFALCLSKLQYSEKLYELYKYRDIFADLGVDVSTTNPEMVDANVVRSQTVITKFLSLGNSFMVDLQTPTLSLKKVYLERSNVPGSFRTEVPPNLPMFVGCGKLCEYMVTGTADAKYLVTTQDMHYNNYLFSAMPALDVKVINNARVVGNTYSLTPAFFLEMKGS